MRQSAVVRVNWPARTRNYWTTFADARRQNVQVTSAGENNSGSRNGNWSIRLGRRHGGITESIIEIGNTRSQRGIKLRPPDLLEKIHENGG